MTQLRNPSPTQRGELRPPERGDEHRLHPVRRALLHHRRLPRRPHPPHRPRVARQEAQELAALLTLRAHLFRMAGDVSLLCKF